MFISSQSFKRTVSQIQESFRKKFREENVTPPQAKSQYFHNNKKNIMKKRKSQKVFGKINRELVNHVLVCLCHERIITAVAGVFDKHALSARA